MGLSQQVWLSLALIGCVPALAADKPIKLWGRIAVIQVTPFKKGTEPMLRLEYFSHRSRKNLALIRAFDGASEVSVAALKSRITALKARLAENGRELTQAKTDRDAHASLHPSLHDTNVGAVNLGYVDQKEQEMKKLQAEVPNLKQSIETLELLLSAGDQDLSAFPSLIPLKQRIRTEITTVNASPARPGNGGGSTPATKGAAGGG